MKKYLILILFLLAGFRLNTQFSRIQIAQAAPTLPLAFTPTTAPTPTASSHNLLSSTHPDTVPTSVTRGSIIVGNATPKWQLFAIGANTTVLTSNGTDLIWATPVIPTPAPTPTNTPTPTATLTPTSTPTIVPAPTIPSVFTGQTTFGTAQDAADAVMFNETAGCITFEGSSADANETRLCVTNPTVGDQRWNIPDRATAATFTFAGLEVANSFTQSNTFSAKTIFGGSSIAHVVNSDIGFCWGSNCAASNTQPSIFWKTIFTPDNWVFGTGTLSNSLLVTERQDNFDFNNGDCGTVACTDPSLWIYSHNQNTAQWGGFWHDATNFNIKTGTGGVKITNHLILAGTAPTLSACGTSPTTVTGSDNAGHFTVGTVATTCTLTFNATWSVIPECFVNDQSGILAVLAVPTTTTITFTTTVASAISSQLISYYCVQGS